MNKNKKIIIVVIVLFIIGSIGSQNEEQENNKPNTEQVTQRPNSENSEQASEIHKESETTAPEAEKPALKEYTEKEYKELCKEIFYDEIFFGETDLEEEYVKLHLFLSEKYYFSSNDKLSSTFQDYNKKYNLKTNFYKCCVLREDSNSYVGKQINLWFSDNFDLEPDNYNTGEKIIVYGQVISWSNNTWDGYNSVTIIPKYIEMEN